jgi:hypothetical protein
MNHFQFDAYQAYSDLRGKYADFLLDTVGVRGGELARRLKDFWTTEGLDSCLFAPLIVQGAFPFKTAEGLADLASEDPTQQKPLHPKTVKLLVAAGIDYSLFAHQVEAIRHARERKTVVVAAGTGSGKTEAFLIPIIDRLIRDHEEGKDDLSQPGVRALIVYPLNALVNNQIDRLLGLLGAQSQITFAYYTSRLKDTYGEAKRYYERLGRPVPPKCQIIDRASLRGLDGAEGRPNGPPHILVTNFSMLEYMLIRPLDRTVFRKEHLFFKDAPRLKMVVLDEAHVYVGAQAAEMHMLLRRTADRFGTELETLQGFATSATLSGGSGTQKGALQDYACKMFSKTSAKVAVIEGKRTLPDAKLPTRKSAPPLANPDGLPSGELVPSSLRTLEFDDQGKPQSLRVDPAAARLAAAAAKTLGLATQNEIDALPKGVLDSPALLLHELCSTHPAVAKLRKKLFDAEVHPTLDEVASDLYGGTSVSEKRRRAAEGVLRLASLARNRHDRLPVIPVRMHAFIRAPLGVYVDPRLQKSAPPSSWPWGKLYLMPKDQAEEFARLPLLVCAECGAPYLEGTVASGGEIGAASGNEATHALHAKATGGAKVPDEWGGQTVELCAFIDRDRFGNRVLQACAHCNSPRPRLRTLRLSPRLALSAMVDTVFPHLGESSAEAAAKPGGGRRLMTFSDSRQEAARIAAQVERSHDIGLNRAMLSRAIGHDTDLLVKELITDLEDNPLLRQRSLALQLTDAEALEDLARLSVFEEFGRPPAGRQNTLESMGLVEVIYPDLPKRPPELTSLLEEEWAAFLATLLDLVRSAGCVSKPSADSEQAKEQDLDELLPYIGKSLVLTAPEPEDVDDDEDVTEDPGRKTVPLVPKKDGTRSRFMDFARRLTAKAGGTPEELLSAAFKAFTAKVESGCKWLRKGPAEQSIQIRLEQLRVRSHSTPQLISELSGAVYHRSIKGVVGRAETGAVRQPTDDEVRDWRARHAIQRVLVDEPMGLWAMEHTAQLDVDRLEEEEKSFRTGNRNLLASSTTMEMGVDIGGLTLVVLTNVPPGPANYWQRAGRAGRRADGTSMTITLALVSAHDQLVFSAPRAFLHSEITPPRVRLDAAPLIMRHVFGYLLSQFFNETVAQGSLGNPMQAFGTVEEFVFLPAGGGVLPAAVKDLGLEPQDPLWVGFSHWLSGLRTGTGLAARVSVLCKGTVLASMTVEQLAAETARGLTDAVEQAERDKAVLDQQRKEEEAKGEGKQDGNFLRALEYQQSSLLGETLISFLASKGFLPRFGFPLDVVRLNTRWKFKKGDKERKQSEVPGGGLRMERALDLALAEYVPGDEVIADKRVFRSAGLERNWFTTDEAMSRRFFFECVNCKHLEDVFVEHMKCPVCGHPAIPEAEFLARKEEEKKHKRKRKDPDFVVADPSLLPPSVVRPYLRPSGFAVKLNRPPRRVAGEIARIGRALSRLKIGSATRRAELVPGALTISYAPSSRVFVRAEGQLEAKGQRGFGFVVCRICGFSEPETGWASPVPPVFGIHTALRGKTKCPGQTSFWRHAVLGTSLPVDALSLELAGELVPNFADPKETEAFYLTLASIAQLAASRCLQVDLRALSSGVSTRRTGTTHTFDAVVYEGATSGLLRQLAEDPAVLVAELRRLLESENQADFVRFDTQFLREQLRPDLVREHFATEQRKALLEFHVETEGVKILRGRGPSLAVIELLDDPAMAVGFVADALASDAFEQEGLLPHVRHRAANPAAKGVPVRLLMGEIPKTTGGPEETLFATKLRRLVEDGVAVRRVAKGPGALGALKWHVVASKGEERSAIGGVWSGKAKEVPRTRFGSEWLDGALPVEAVGEEAKKASVEFEKLWAEATDIKPADLEPKPIEKTTIVSVKAGSASPADWHPKKLLDRALQVEGGLAGIGAVTRLLYVDRYIARGTVPMYFLKELLAGFKYAPEAMVVVRSQAADPDSGSPLSVSEIFSKRIFNLKLGSSASMQKWCITQLASLVAVQFDLATDLPHARKLLVEFAVGSKLKTLKVCFDQGLDWMRTTTKYGSWSQGSFIAGETQVVILRDHALAGEGGWHWTK